MATRHVLFLALGIAFSSTALVPPPARAEEGGNAQPQGQVDNARFQFKGVVTRTAFVRSGPREDFYATTKLGKGAEVTVVGIKHEWLKILPPEGSFSYVPGADVEPRGDGSRGRVTNALNVRAGSSENRLKTTVQTRLPEGRDVTILGKEDEYYKIVPPEGAYLFIHKQYVKPTGRGLPAEKHEPKDEHPTPEGSTGGGASAEALGDGAADDDAEGDGEAAAADRDAIRRGVERVQGDPAPGTQPVRSAAPKPAPAAAAAMKEFRKLEAEYEAAGKQPVVDQPIERLTAGYAKLVKAGTLTGSTKKLADARLIVLGMRADARERLEAFRKDQEQMRERQQELAAEKQEIDERIAETHVARYAAVGTLRVSSLQQGDTTLYRLTDPGTRRTVVYLRSNDPKLSGLLNQFVGVRGDVTSDRRLNMKFITPTDTERVDPAKVNNTVIATITPPSMAATASVDPAEPAAAE